MSDPTGSRAATVHCAGCGEPILVHSDPERPRRCPECAHATPDRAAKMRALLQRFYELGYNESQADHRPIEVSLIEANEALAELSDAASEFEVASLQRGRVATWIELKFAEPTMDNEFYRRVWGDEYLRVVQQLWTDAVHSGLLWRLFNGEEPRD